MSILGETTVSGEFKGNKIELNALVSKGGDPLLLGQPGAEKLGLVLDFDNKTLKFRNGTTIKYRSTQIECSCNTSLNLQTVQVRKVFLQSPKLQNILLPGDNIKLACTEDLPDGRYAIHCLYF